MIPHIDINQSRDLIDILTVIFGGVGLVVVTVYTIVTYRLLKTTQEALAETRRSNEGTEKSNEIATRAWLVAELKSGPRVSGATFINVVVSNVGRAPATDIGIVSRIAFVQDPPGIPDQIWSEIPDDIGKAAILGAGAVIGAGRSHKFLAGPFPPLSDEDVSTVLKRQALTFLYCRIEYKDIYDLPRVTEACWRFSQDHAGEIDWIVAPKHNRLE